MSADEKTNEPDALAGIDPAKRATLTRLLVGSSFAAPIIASFAMDGLTISQAQAKPSNSTVFTTSDRRLKTGIRRLATLSSGLGLYRFKYLWSETEYVGVMAQEVRELMPQAVAERADGFLQVNYAVLGLEMLTYADWQKRHAALTRSAA